MSGKIVFRGSASKPEEKFSEGFYPRHAQQGGVANPNGWTNEFGISAQTVEVHRADALDRLKARTSAEATRLVTLASQSTQV
jgi:hypothetical protein